MNLQNISQNTNSPHVCIESYRFHVSYFRGSELRCSPGYMYWDLRIQLAGKTKVYEFDAGALLSLAYDVLRLQVEVRGFDTVKNKNIGPANGQPLYM